MPLFKIQWLFTGLRTKLQLSVAWKALYHLCPGYLSDLISNHLLCSFGWASCLLACPQPQRAYPHRRACALAVPPFWKTLTPNILRIFFLYGVTGYI